jgi:hypothetical protein
MEFIVHNSIIHGRAAMCKPTIESDTMKDTIKDILTSIALGLILCALALHGLDALFY